MGSGRNTPSDDFTDKVMAKVKKRPRKIGLWNLVYFVPIVAVILLLVMPTTQKSLINMTSQKHVAVAKVQNDIDNMYSIMTEIEQLDFDQETQEIFNDVQPTEE